MEKFIKIKEEILKRAKESGACSEEYVRAYKSETFAELLKVITDNFLFSCENKIIDVPMLEEIGAEICNDNGLFFNCDVSSGYCLVSGSATVRAWGSATVRAWGSATVRAWGSATVRAWDSATVEASGSATVEAWGSAYVNSLNTIEHKVSDFAILRYFY